jgi:ribosome-associated translation inhibitor RaiA
MKIQINTDKNIPGRESLAQNVETILEQVLARFSEQITRVEVHLSDENSSTKAGTPDKRCLLEVRLAGRQPSSVSEQAQTVDQAVRGAAQKMISSLESETGKLGKH